jgi:hypothetical protein
MTQRHLIALAISYQREPLLARGFGLEHLRELMLSIAGPIIRRGASLSYGGNWKPSDDNFTHTLLQLISAEQEDSSANSFEEAVPINRLVNHSAWPDYLDVTPRIEAQWILSCHMVRITQAMAGIAPADIVRDDQVHGKPEERTDREVLNVALTLSAMRRLAMTPMSVSVPEHPKPEEVSGIAARIMLGGKVNGYSGFMPGLFEEALVSLEHQSPLFVLGGFGGAAGALAAALLEPSPQGHDALSFLWHVANNPKLARLVKVSETPGVGLPPGTPSIARRFSDLQERLEAARLDPQKLNTGLGNDETRELLETRDMRRAVQLVWKGLVALGLVPG